MDSELFHAYVAGFWDGEGWLVIGLERKEGRSDIHRIGVHITQRARHRDVLDQIQAEFGGNVTIRDTRLRESKNWAEQCDWHIHQREQIERFCLAIQPYSIVKAPQVQIALEFVQGFQVAPLLRDSLGRAHGRSISLEEIERREALRLRLKEANVRGSDRSEKIVHPSTRVQHVDRSHEVLTADPANVSRGERRYNSVLNDEIVRTIRYEFMHTDVKMVDLAMRYGVSPAAIRQVINRVSWRHVEDAPPPT